MIKKLSCSVSHITTIRQNILDFYTRENQSGPKPLSISSGLVTKSKFCVLSLQEWLRPEGLD